MKKIFAVSLILISVINLCACSRQENRKVKDASTDSVLDSNLMKNDDEQNNIEITVLGWGAVDDISIEKVQEGILGDPIAKEIDCNTYYDKALAGFIGHLAGLTTGYEFIKVSYPFQQRLGAPASILKDLTYGPYGGGDYYDGWDGKVANAGEDRIRTDGKIESDDDLHVDIFNQTIFNENIDQFCELLRTEFSDPEARNAAALAIKEAWLKYGVSDWGGGERAMYLMSKYPKDDTYIPPYTGTWEAGNVFHWCTEAYIENETIGMNLPGMPQSAAKLGNLMGSVTGDGESLILAEFWSAMYSEAFFEDSSVELLRKVADGIIPKNSWIYNIYQKCEELYQKYPDEAPLNDNEVANWRLAVNELGVMAKDYYDIDDLGCTPDINFGLAVLAFLYGNNDYDTTGRLSGVMGADSDCYTAAVLGVMGIVKGMDGTPDIVKERIYQDGEGLYVNDKTFTPHIMNDYPEQQKITDIVKLYQQNAESFIVANGGSIHNGVYIINSEAALRPETVIIDNSDFESGILDNWTGDLKQGAATLAETVGVYNPEDTTSYVKTIANSGAYRGTVRLTEETGEGSLYLKLDHLEANTLYKATAYIAGENTAVQLFAEGDDRESKKIIPAVNSEIPDDYPGSKTGWYLREVYFTTHNGKADVGIMVDMAK